MEPSRPYRPRVSRETRLLLTAAFAAVAVLWILARVRFPDRPPTPNPIPPLLTQLAAGSRFEDLASELSQLQPRIQPLLFTLNAGPQALAVRGATPSYQPLALRIRGDLVVALLPTDVDEESLVGQEVVARDRASGLAVLRIPVESVVAPPTPWSPRRLQQPRYLVATDVSRQEASLRPVFVGTLEPVSDPAWLEPIWSVPAGTDAVPGSFLFTTGGNLAGLVVVSDGDLGIVPGNTLIAEVDRLLSRPPQSPGELGLDVQSLTPSLAAATGASVGVLVAWVKEGGPSSGKLLVGDAIEAVNQQVLASRQHWDVLMARLSTGDMISLRVRRRGELHEVQLVASTPTFTSSTLGLVMRRHPGMGADIVRIDRGSAADRAGLRVGDVITSIGDLDSPTPAQVSRAYSAARDGQPVLLAITRGQSHYMMTLGK